MDINIKALAVHILDSSTGAPVLTSSLHPRHTEADEFIAKHISRVLADGRLKDSRFLAEESNEALTLCRQLQQDAQQFLPVTQALAQKLYQIMQQYLDIPSADLVCALAAIEERDYLLLLKMNYKTSFIHHLGYENGAPVNAIIQQRTTLPSAGQKVDEAIVVDLSDLSLRLIEQRADLNGEREFYLSPLFLNCALDLSGQEKVKMLEKTAVKVIDKYFGEDELEKRFQFKEAINEHVEEDGQVNVEAVAQRVFGNIPQVKAAYLEELNQKGLEEPVIPVNHQRDEEYYKQQRLVTDTGIEIKLPVSEYDNKEKIEFITNPDGTISILIKNIRSIKK